MKQWVKPNVVRVVRSGPEENVLASCKRSDGGGPESGAFACQVNPCNNCSSIASS
jgi:hypothetical protein